MVYNVHRFFICNCVQKRLEMAKKKPIKVNPVAKALGAGTFKPRVVRDRTRYTRKEKHKSRDEGGKL